MWATEGRNAASLQAFFDGLTDEQKASIRAVSIDMSAGYEKAIRATGRRPARPGRVRPVPRRASSAPRRPTRSAAPSTTSTAAPAPTTGKWIKGVRYSLLKDPAKQTARQLLKLAEVQQTNKRMYRAFLLYGELRYVYKVPKHEARRAPRRVARVGIPLAAETVRQARAHDPQTQSRRARSGRDRDQQRTPRSAKQQGEIDLTPRIRIPLRRRADRDDLPLLRRHPNRAPSPMSHPQIERRATKGVARVLPWRSSTQSRRGRTQSTIVRPTGRSEPGPAARTYRAPRVATWLRYRAALPRRRSCLLTRRRSG